MCKDAIVFLNMPLGTELEGGKTYSFCACGRSKDGIFCDDSHQGTSCEPKVVKIEKSKAYQLCRCKSSNNFPFCDGTHSYYSDDKVGGPVGFGE